MRHQSKSTATDDPLTKSEKALHEPNTIDNFINIIYIDWDLEDKLIHELVSEIDSRLKQENIKGARRAFFLADLVRALTPPPPALPKKAPEFYKDRKDRSEKPGAFVRRVYRQWLEQPGGLPRPVLRAIDQPCYRALYKHGIPDDLAEQMPTAQGRSVDDLSRSDQDILLGYRTRNATMQREHQARKRKRLST